MITLFAIHGFHAILFLLTWIYAHFSAISTQGVLYKGHRKHKHAIGARSDKVAIPGCKWLLLHVGT